MSAEEKEKVLKDWQRFVAADFDKARFTKRLYDHLIQHCSFIAHYNQAGFYATYFGDPEDTLRFMKQFDKNRGCISVEYGMTYWLTAEDYRDINTALVEANGALQVRSLSAAKAESKGKEAWGDRKAEEGN